jgi:hypothetical protein
MSSVDRYIKAAKNILIKSSEENLEKKIIQRIANVSRADEKLIDEKFLDYMKRINSRPYVLSEWILNNPGKLGLALAASAAFGLFIYMILKKTKK